MLLSRAERARGGEFAIVGTHACLDGTGSSRGSQRRLMELAADCLRGGPTTPGAVCGCCRCSVFWLVSGLAAGPVSCCCRRLWRCRQVPHTLPTDAWCVASELSTANQALQYHPPLFQQQRPLQTQFTRVWFLHHKHSSVAPLLGWPECCAQRTAVRCAALVPPFPLCVLRMQLTQP